MTATIPYTDRVLRMKDLQIKTGKKKSSIYQMINEGAFPRPLKLGERARGWRESEIDAWISKRERAA